MGHWGMALSYLKRILWELAIYINLSFNYVLSSPQMKHVEIRLSILRLRLRGCNSFSYASDKRRPFWSSFFYKKHYFTYNYIRNNLGGKNYEDWKEISQDTSGF